MIRPTAAILAVALCCPLIPLAAEDQAPHAEGVDVIKAAGAVKDWVAPPSHGDKPWSDDIAALTGSDSRAQRSAISNLIRRGVVVLPDLTVLAKDRDWLLRSRVVEVAGGIGGADSAPLLLSLSRDGEARVREAAVLGLGRCTGPGVFERLVECLGAAEAEIRAAAAKALGSLGDVRALGPLAKLEDDGDDLAKRAMTDSLGMVTRRPEAVPELARLLAATRGAQRNTLLDASATLQDPRLCPALVSLVELAPAKSQAWTSWLAIKALGANGDSRAWQVLCRVAAEAPQPELRDAAAASLHALTGKAGAGQAWTLWWRDHAAEAPRMMERDAMLADLHDPAHPIDAAQLERFSVTELAPVLDGALGLGAPWWPARAFRILESDDHARWNAELAARARATIDVTERLALIIFIDQLGGGGSEETLRAIAKDLDARMAVELASAKEGNRVPPDHGPELLALKVALERHRAAGEPIDADRPWKR